MIAANPCSIPSEVAAGAPTDADETEAAVLAAAATSSTAWPPTTDFNVLHNFDMVTLLEVNLIKYFNWTSIRIVFGHENYSF